MAIQRVLVVDDDSLSREFLVDAITALGYQAEEASGPQEALAKAASAAPDLVLSDLRMPEMDGIALTEALRKEHADLPVVLVTAHGTIENAVRAMRLGATDFLLKPCTPETLELVLARVARTQQLERENEYLRGELVGGGNQEIVAQSPCTLETLRSAARIARSKGTVLITGESGTGKERIAHYIHRNSPRNGGPFIRVNCAALSEQLLESELFGHERGAFTGAHRTHAGRFELADGGTLMLDEIGEISPALQSKLLRVLEEEEFERVGGTVTMKIDVRVIATTNRDLPNEVAERRFREDLFYRLHVLPLEIAPLRERPEDVLPLAEHFLAHYASADGRPAPRLDREAVERLEQWSWPGNVRELENVIQRAVVLVQGDTISPDDLAFGPAGVAPEPTPFDPERDDKAERERDLGPRLANLAMADIERVAILATLECTGGNKTEAARRLGLTARTLSNKIKLWRGMGLPV